MTSLSLTKTGLTRTRRSVLKSSAMSQSAALGILGISILCKGRGDTSGSFYPIV